ncbi:MAG TPA: DUF6515 family protein [Candidatus Eisenbacteria bacterium]|nr:DUF6515 family protein [Candidatus Eisenbacteria bacterium]
MNRAIQNLFSVTLVLLLSCAPSFAQRGGGSARTSVNRANVNQGNLNRNANVNSNKNVNANINKNYNANVNRNVNVNVHHDVDVHGGYYGGGCCYHPVATAAAVTATAMVTAAVIGSMVNTLPPSCTVVMINGLTYQQCGNTWYQPQFVGTSTTYVVVAAPR